MDSTDPPANGPASTDTGTLRRSPRQARAKQTVGNILDAAEQLIAEEGQVTFTAQRLAELAGISIGAVYFWFEDLNVVVDETAKRIVQEIDMAVPLVANDPLDVRIGTLRSIIAAHPATAVLAITGRPDGARSVVTAALDKLFPGQSAVIAADHIDWHRHPQAA